MSGLYSSVLYSLSVQEFLTIDVIASKHSAQYFRQWGSSLLLKISIISFPLRFSKIWQKKDFSWIWFCHFWLTICLFSLLECNREGIFTSSPLQSKCVCNNTGISWFTLPFRAYTARAKVKQHHLVKVKLIKNLCFFQYLTLQAIYKSKESRIQLWNMKCV